MLEDRVVPRLFCRAHHPRRSRRRRRRRSCERWRARLRSPRRANSEQAVQDRAACSSSPSGAPPVWLRLGQRRAEGLCRPGIGAPGGRMRPRVRRRGRRCCCRIFRLRRRRGRCRRPRVRRRHRDGRTAGVDTGAWRCLGDSWGQAAVGDGIEALHQLRNVGREDCLQRVEAPRVQLLELGEVAARLRGGERVPKLGHVREVPRGQVVPLHHGVKDVLDARDELALLSVLAAHFRHLRPEVLQQESLHTHTPCPCHQGIDSAHGAVARHRREVGEQRDGLALKEWVEEVSMPQRRVPKGAHVDAAAFRRAENAGERPGQRRVDPQQLLGRERVRLVHHHTHLVVVALQHLDHALELVGDVHLVRVEHEEDEVGPRRKPAHHVLVRVEAVLRLLPAGKHAGRVDECASAREEGRHFAAREFGEEGIAKASREFVEGRVRVRCEGVSGQLSRRRAVHDGLEAVSRGLRADVHAREVGLEQVADEGGLAHRVLPDQQHHRPGLPVAIGEERIVEMLHQALLLEWAYLGHVDRPHTIEDGVERSNVALRAAPLRHS
mmetsp:Transcript_122/g.410  ORF Transcript_122/g.410 Transcript_122/m.410 type:complete len:552 (-) Transcript_122:7-1662(-)